MESHPERPLAGLRLIDHADDNGELCVWLLADLGAEVIRIEPPGGAASRRLPPFHGATSLYFTVRNLGKRSVTLDMETAEGRRRLDGLLMRPTYGSSRIGPAISNRSESIVAMYSTDECERYAN